MTRRDYCSVCEEMVHDYDVNCDECGVSICHECATAYDEISRLLILQARTRVLCEPRYSYGEIRQLIKDLNSESVKNMLIQSDKKREEGVEPGIYVVYDDDDDKEIKDKNNEILDERICISLFLKVLNKHNTEMADDVECDNKEIMKAIKKYFNQRFNIYEIFTFKCNMCNQGVKVVY